MKRNLFPLAREEFTMNITPYSMVNGQKLDHGHWHPGIFPMLMVKIGIFQSNFMSCFALPTLNRKNLAFSRDHDQNFDHKSGRGPIGQKLQLSSHSQIRIT